MRLQPFYQIGRIAGIEVPAGDTSRQNTARLSSRHLLVSVIFANYTIALAMAQVLWSQQGPSWHALAIWTDRTNHRTYWAQPRSAPPNSI